MQLLDAIFIKPHGIFLQTILKDQDLSYEDIEGFLKTINEDLRILLPQMTYVNKRISSRKSKRLWNSKWFECQVTLTHLIDCMIQVLPAIQAALNDCIHKESLDNADRRSVNARLAKLNQFKIDPKRIIQKMEQITDKTAESKYTRLRILSDAAELFSSMLLICNSWLKTMIAAELGSES